MRERPKKSHTDSVPSPEITLRELELEDLSLVFALGEKLFPADEWPNLYRTWDRYQLVDLFASDGETCLVAEMDGKVVGFALGTMIEKRRTAWTYGYLLWLGVDPDAGPRGIGSRLFSRLQEIFIDAGARMMLVDTAAENEHALCFFRKQGFGNEQGHLFLHKNLDQEREEIEKRRKRRKRSSRARRIPAIRTVKVEDSDDS